MGEGRRINLVEHLFVWRVGCYIRKFGSYCTSTNQQDTPCFLQSWIVEDIASALRCDSVPWFVKTLWSIVFNEQRVPRGIGHDIVTCMTT